MSLLTDYSRNLLGRVLCGRLPILPMQVFLGLGTGGGAQGLTGEPPPSTGYARQRVTFTGTGTQESTEPLLFTFTEAAGTLTHCGLFDAPVGGNPLTWSPLMRGVTVEVRGTVTINPGSLRVAVEGRSA